MCSDLFHTGAEVDLFQALTGHEGVVVDDLDVVAHIHSLQEGAHAKGVIADLHHAIRDVHLGQPVQIGAGGFTDDLQRISAQRVGKVEGLAVTIIVREGGTAVLDDVVPSSPPLFVHVLNGVALRHDAEGGERHGHQQRQQEAEQFYRTFHKSFLLSFFALMAITYLDCISNTTRYVSTLRGENRLFRGEKGVKNEKGHPHGWPF